jgi:hypothetical protein
MPELIDLAISEIRQQSPDVLAVTGDLVDTPFYGMDDSASQERARKDQMLLREIIDPVGCPVLYLFGNHDHPKVFQDVFADQNPDVTIGGYRFLSFYDEEVTDNCAERIGEQRKRFESVLADGDPTPQIHLQHYMIWPENNRGYPHSYRKAAEMKSQIVSSGKVRLSLSGHFHGGVDAFEEDGTWFATTRAFCEHPHPFRFYELDGNNVQQSEHTLGPRPPGRTYFVDIPGLLEPLKHDRGFLSALVEMKNAGWFIVGVAGPPTQETFEQTNDALIGELADVGVDLDAVANRHATDTVGTAPYRNTISDLNIDPGSSWALLSNQAEADAARSVGIKTVVTKRENAIRDLTKEMS